MRYIKSAFLALLFPVMLQAQVLNYQTFDFPKIEKVKTDTLGSAEAKSVVVCEKRCVEYIYNKNSEVERYYFLYRKVFIKSDLGIEENNRIYISGTDLSDVLIFKARVICDKGECSLPIICSIPNTKR